MKRIQKLLAKLPYHRVEIYSDGFYVHNYDEGTEKDFNTKGEVINHLNNLINELTGTI